MSLNWMTIYVSLYSVGRPVVVYSVSLWVKDTVPNRSKRLKFIDNVLLDKRETLLPVELSYFTLSRTDLVFDTRWNHCH